ncbi:hypothetical protein L3X38_038821 [Prunus dulcis]|uniref:Subtilisin-like serine endopeptidase family protein n=1 Tax=Prunus dulcis TaxID=3755 RepID=A0AAD4V689_PRUDU|nr:hypothetical protein L3X38_038821 [Prunus dulcis]
MRVLQNLLVIVLGTYVLATLAQETTQDGFDARKPYIVYMGELPGAETSAMARHHNLLVQAIGDEKIARASRIHSYGRTFNGFAARLLPHEAKALAEEDSVVSVFPNTMRQLHTTRSWDFLDLPIKLKKGNAQIQSNIVVGVLDTGIYLDGPSFNDTGYGPPPSKWKGKCVKGDNFKGCNNKVIGAKYFNLDSNHPWSGKLSPVDDEGHGTHTASTIAGIPVQGASVYGIAKGTARGGAPLSRIAVYKVCWPFTGCSDIDMLAAFDEAIADGVDLISISIGGPSRSFWEDPIAIGSFHAMKKGIFVSCSAGNDGPSEGTVQNVAPWVTTVAANTIDRELKTVIKLGNGKRFSGNALNTYTLKKQMYPLTSGTLASNKSENSYGNASACDSSTLNADKVKGRIVYCLGSSGQDFTIQRLRGAGTLMTQYELEDYAYSPVIPGTGILVKDGIKIDQYINSTKNPMAVIYKTRTVKTPDAPNIASFSARGPQRITPNILKPDISAPGINILAAYSRLASISGDPEDKRFSLFNMMSGTSMACPHVTAAAAYVKSFHPDWSPAAIKSALMTTATPINTRVGGSTLGTGAGQVDPKKAAHPGLIYDITVDDYISFLCKQGYNSTNIGILGGKKNVSCSDYKPPRGTDGLNYPSMHLHQQANDTPVKAVFYRRVTNVGYGSSVYKVNLIMPKFFSITVTPSTLKFTRSHQKRSFKVVVSGGTPTAGVPVSAVLEWGDHKHSVRSLITLYKDPS